MNTPVANRLVSFTPIFALLVLVHIALNYMGAAHLWQLLSKTALVGSLMVLVAVVRPVIEPKYMFPLGAALLFSLFGDIALDLQWKDADMLIPGIACFLIAQLAYARLFYLLPLPVLRVSMLRRKPWVITALTAYAVFLFSLIRPYAGPFTLPVLIYMIAILTMVAMAMHAGGRLRHRANFYRLVAGAILFMLSDSFLALNKFGYAFEYAPAAIMATYGAAQYLLVTGTLLDLSERRLPEP